MAIDNGEAEVLSNFAFCSLKIGRARGHGMKVSRRTFTIDMILDDTGQGSATIVV